jgi:hypothetical protein
MNPKAMIPPSIAKGISGIRSASRQFGISENFARRML